MDDLYSALIQGVPTQSDRQAALAAALRRQNILGQMGVASGDRTLAPTGRELVSGANTGAEELAKERETQNQQNIAQQWHEQQVSHEQAQLDQQMKIANMTDARQRELAQLLAQNRLDVQGEKNAATKKVPTTAAKELSQMEDSLEGVKGAISSYQPGFGGAGRSLENWASTAPVLSSVMPEEAKDAQNWWANYGRQFTLPELKATVGLRHNQYMQELFESYHLKPSMQDDQIKTNLSQIHDQLYNRMSRRVKELSDQGYNIDGYEQYLPGAPQSGQPSQTPGTKYIQAARGQTQQTQPQANFLQQALKASPNPLVNPTAGLFSGGLGGP